jgi:mannan endo-1,4-beta-mannosidase
LSENEREIEMLDINGDGYFEVDLKTESIGYGLQTLVAVASYENGSQQTDKISIKVDRPITGYEVGTVYDFEDGSAQGWQAEGTWQADWKDPAVEVSDDLGKNMLKLNLVWSGENDWEELKLEHKSVQNFSEHKRLQYDLYIPANKENEGGVRPYAALGDGWVKLDTDKHRSPVKELKRVSKNGQEYYVQTIDIELGDITSKQPHLLLCIVGDKLPLDGAVYIDSIKLLKPIY